MHKKIEEIKKLERSPRVIKNLYSKEEIKEFLNLYEALPTTTHNKKQNVIKKRWLQGYNNKLEKLFCERLKNEIGDFKMDNLQADDGKDVYGLLQKSYAPIGLHVDSGFNFENQIYRQSLIPLTPVGSTVIFKNRFYGNSTTFTLDPVELEKKPLTLSLWMIFEDNTIFKKEDFETLYNNMQTYWLPEYKIEARYKNDGGINQNETEAIFVFGKN